MFKKVTLALAALLVALGVQAQEPTGGVKGSVVSRTDRAPIQNAAITLVQGTVTVAETVTDEQGAFLIPHLENGMYDLIVNAAEYLETRVNVTVNDGYVKNLFTISLTLVKSEVTDEFFEEFDMDDTGYADTPTILFGQNDVFNNIAGYNFSAVRFRARGYASETQDVYVAGVRLNDAVTGYSPYSLWSGLNEATRTKSSVSGSEISDYGVGGYNGLTNLPLNASNVRTGWRGSVLTNSALYRLRLMLTYASGRLDNGWSYAFNASVRMGGNDWVRGVYYRSFDYYGAVEKFFNDTHKLGFVFMAAPGERGKANASTQEVYDLMGDNMYNSNWGYQNGKVRNSRVSITHEPIAILKYDFTPSDKFKGSATLLYRFGRNGNTALDWYDAADPRPDYYKNLPSYFYMENTDYKRLNPAKAAWAHDSWDYQIPEIVHVDWDRMINVNNQNYEEGERRSKYIVQERRVDQKDFNAAVNFRWRTAKFFTLTGGADIRVNQTEFFNVVNDLLGGDYFLDVDNFAERDFAAYPTMVQNDLDYFMHEGHARKVRKGDKYGNDYYAQIRNGNLWASGRLTLGNFSANVAGQAGFSAFWREGLVRKGLFPGVTETGAQIIWNGQSITTYDDEGQPITSYGTSKVQKFFTYSGKVNLNYVIKGGHRFYASGGYFNEAPHFNQAFMSPRTRNSVVPNLTTTKILTGDVNYQFSSNGYHVRLTGYYTTIKDQSKVMSFFDDSQNSMTNFAMSGIDERHVGLEFGFKVPTFIPSLSLQGVLSYGKYIYTSNPKMYQTVDNNATIVADTYGVTIPYWKSHPTEDGGTVQHYVPSTPQLAASLGFAWNKNYWFIDADVDYFDKAYLDMNPLYRTDMATAGPDKMVTYTEVDYMASQEKFDPAWLVNVSVGKSWYIHRKYQIGFSLNVKNVLNNKSVKTGGYEQTRIVENTSGKERYYRFDPKYFYMAGTNYMLNIYFRF